MSWKHRLALLSGAALIAHFATAAAPKPAARAAPRVEQKVTGPVANYWVSAATSSGSGFGAMGMGASGGGKPSMGDLMRMMRGGNQVIHNLDLRLGSTLAAAGAPKADHAPGVAQLLPLVTPKAAPPAPVAEETVEEQPTMPERPRGRMLIFWGCGDHAAPGQPYVIDFAKISLNQPMPRFPYVAVHHQNPPSAGRYKTYGEWPYGGAREKVPASLVGDHVVKGNYSPEIRFTLPPGKDYMPPLVLDATGKSPAGATLLNWQPVTGATGYFAAMFGASPDGKGDPTIVMWSSSTIETMAGMGLLDYLAPAEVRRLIAQKVVMAPNKTQCAIPSEVTNNAPMGMLSMIAYGDEANFADPPRPADPKMPWNISWSTKVRYKSTAGVMLGMPAMGGGVAQRGTPDADEQGQPQEAPRKKKGGWMSKLKDAAEAAGAIPH